MNQEIPNDELPVHLLALPMDFAITKSINHGDHFEIFIRRNTAFPACSTCSSPDCGIHDYPMVRIRHILCGGKPTVLTLSKRRFRCRTCQSVFGEEYDFISPIAQISEALRMEIINAYMSPKTSKQIALEYSMHISIAHKVFDAVTFDSPYPVLGAAFQYLVLTTTL